MTDKDWDDIPYVDGDCIRDEAEWTDMVTYIKHSAACDFTIYDDEASTNQVLLVSYAANVTTVEGTDDTGGALVLKGNSVNDYSKIIINGNGNLEFFAPNGGGIFKFYDGADWCGFMQDDVPNTSFIIGTQSDKDLWFKPNGTGEVRWGTEVTNAGSDRGKLIPMRTDGGVLVYIKTYDLV